MGWMDFLFSLFPITAFNLEMKGDIEWWGSGFYLYSQDYGTLCFLPSDRDTLIPHGQPLSTAGSSAECHWHMSPSNRSKSSTPATVRPLRHQPQPNKHVPSEGKERADRQEISDCYSVLNWKPVKQIWIWHANFKMLHCCYLTYLIFLTLKSLKYGSRYFVGGSLNSLHKAL